jgi:hypothetical protein
MTSENALRKPFWGKDGPLHEGGIEVKEDQPRSGILEKRGPFSRSLSPFFLEFS